MKERDNSVFKIKERTEPSKLEEGLVKVENGDFVRFSHKAYSTCLIRIEENGKWEQPTALCNQDEGWAKKGDIKTIYNKKIPINSIKEIKTYT